MKDENITYDIKPNLRAALFTAGPKSTESSERRSCGVHSL